MVKWMCTLFFAASIFAACSSEPAPLPPEKPSEGGSAVPDDGGDTGGDQLALGAQLYESKCADCHDPLESSAKAGATVDRIAGAAEIGPHSGVSPWPSDEDAAALEAALAQ